MNATNLSQGGLAFENVSCQDATGNPWCEHSEISKVVEIVYLTLVSVIGTFGNLLVIFSIVLLKKTHQNGNMFIVNLAVADLLMTGIFVPLIISNVYNGGNFLPYWLCSASGFVAILSGSCSCINLAAVAGNRYWAIVRNPTYNVVFSKRNVYVMVSITWMWSTLFTLPPIVLSEHGIKFSYDPKAMACVWSMRDSVAYDVCLMIFVVFIPIMCICFFYWRLYRRVKHRGTWLRRSSEKPSTEKRGSRHRSIQNEVNLLKTLAVTVLVFLLCWAPYGIMVVIGDPSTPPLLHKAFGWLTVTNSSLNFIIYGVINRRYRNGYKAVLKKLFCVKRCNRSQGAFPPLKVNFTLPEGLSSGREDNFYAAGMPSKTAGPLGTARQRVVASNADEVF